MSGYIKVCPRCGHRNDELASMCERDGEFLGMVPAIPRASAGPMPTDTAPGTAPGPEPILSDEEQAAQGAHSVILAPGAAVPAKALYLDVESAGQCFPVRDGWSIGQSHPSGTAEIQLADMPGTQYVHRRHCTFDFIENQWRVRPLPQPDYTNPTFLNDRKLAVGQVFPLHNGDTLRLAGISVRVRIVDL